MSIVLASGSPRRKQLLEMLGVQDLLIIPAVGEEIIQEGLAPDELVKSLARQKAQEVAASRPQGDVIIAADTIVWHNGRVFGKPHSEQEAHSMLRELSGVSHYVYTGLCIIADGKLSCESQRTEVHFKELSDREIDAYIKTGEPMDKAGSYGAQGKGAMFITAINGDFFNVMGLPLCHLGGMLKERGVVLL